MKTTRMCYNDDGVLIPGVLIQRLFRKPVFVSMEPGCGWDAQTICGKAEEKNLHPYSKYLYQEARQNKGTGQQETVAEQSWISVKEWLPDEGKRVLGFTGTCTRMAAYMGEDGKGETRWWTDYHDRTITAGNLFTHWMPLPQPPEE